jgi:putative sterol carrier protein
MSKALQSAAKRLAEKFAGSGFDGAVKFEVEDEGVIHVADEVVSLEDGEADVTISASLDTFKAIFGGEMSATMAYLTGRMRIEGNIGLAMKLGKVLG